MNLLPMGTWITFNNVALGTTKEDVAAFLLDSGVELSPDCIVVSEHRTRSQVIVSLRHNDVTSLLHRAILDKPLNGQVPDLVYRTRKV
jgi:hypothetical protein